MSLVKNTCRRGLKLSKAQILFTQLVVTVMKCEMVNNYWAGSCTIVIDDFWPNNHETDDIAVTNGFESLEYSVMDTVGSRDGTKGKIYTTSALCFEIISYCDAYR